MKDEGIFVDFRIAASYRIPMSVVSLRRYSGRNGIMLTRFAHAATQHFRVNTYPFAIAADNG